MISGFTLDFLPLYFQFAVVRICNHGLCRLRLSETILRVPICVLILFADSQKSFSVSPSVYSWFLQILRLRLMANPQDSRQHAVAGPEVGPDVAPARSVTPVFCAALAVSPAPLGSMCAFDHKFGVRA